MVNWTRCDSPAPFPKVMTYPDAEAWYLVYDERDGLYGIALWDTKYLVFLEDGSDHPFFATHWAPLSPPPDERPWHEEELNDQF